MSLALLERPGLLAPAAAQRAWPPPAHPHDLRVDENANIHGGAWFAGLSAPLRQAILLRAQIRRLPAGTPLALRGDTGAHWFGVARGAVRLGTALVDGRSFTLDFVGPRQWFGDIAVVDDKPLTLDVVTHVPSTLVLVAKPELRQLIDRHPELRDALLQLNCQRLRHMFRRFEELHTLPLAQRLARQMMRLAHQFGRVQSQGICIDLNVSQGDLAAMVGGSRQRINRAWRQMHLLGIVEREPSRLVVRDRAALEAVALGQLALPSLTVGLDAGGGGEDAPA
jgi:CRP-like cAMP-binding protein